MAESLKIASYGQGYPLVFIHGWGLNSGVWQPTIDCLRDQFEIITVDLPGFGINVENTCQPYSIENIAEAIVTAVGKPAVYIGWSLGGLVCSQIALAHQENSLALITIASSPCFVEQENNASLWPGIKAHLLAGFHRQLSDDIQKTLDGFLRIQAMGSPHLRQDIKQIRNLVMQYPLPSRTTLDDSLALLETVDLRSQLQQITLPFFQLYGRLDSLVPKTIPALVSELNPTSEQHIFPQASHAPFISHFDEFIEVLTQWLKTTLIK
jgi:pimeloyl-[acyl-carrier protein] methyl ester esterase